MVKEGVPGSFQKDSTKMINNHMTCTKCQNPNDVLVPYFLKSGAGRCTPYNLAPVVHCAKLDEDGEASVTDNDVLCTKVTCHINSTMLSNCMAADALT